MIDMGFEESLQAVLDYLPLTNLKPDTEEAEDIEKLKINLGSREKYRQVNSSFQKIDLKIDLYVHRDHVFSSGAFSTEIFTVKSKQ